VIIHERELKCKDKKLNQRGFYLPVFFKIINGLKKRILIRVVIQSYETPPLDKFSW
jgi:hypothetical protein